MRRRTGPGQSRPQIVICRCRSHCTTYNPITRLYEGSGQPQSRPTRDNHARDDRLLNSRIARRNIADNPPLLLPTTGSVLATWLGQTFTECEILMNLPLSHPGRPLIFLNPPEANGPFVWPSTDEVLLPNTGLYALSNHRSNQAFLTVAHRLHALLLDANHYIRTNQESQYLTSLTIQLSEKMHQLMRLREVEWSQQRGASGVDAPYVNTGKGFIEISENRYSLAETYPRVIFPTDRSTQWHSVCVLHPLSCSRKHFLHPPPRITNTSRWISESASTTWCNGRRPCLHSSGSNIGFTPRLSQSHH